MNRIFSSVVFALLVASVLGDATQYSYSPSKGWGGGTEVTLTGTGRITAVRLWAASSSHVYGLQLRFGAVWSRVMGRTYGSLEEMELFEGEAIVQVSGKYGHYIQQLFFVTNRGRFLMAGQPSQYSFNMYPTHKDAELVFVSGRVTWGLSSFGAHWAVVDDGTH